MSDKGEQPNDELMSEDEEAMAHKLWKKPDHPSLDAERRECKHCGLRIYLDTSYNENWPWRHHGNNLRECYITFAEPIDWQARAEQPAAPLGGTVGLDGGTRRCCNNPECDNDYPCSVHPEHPAVATAKQESRSLKEVMPIEGPKPSTTIRPVAVTGAHRAETSEAESRSEAAPTRAEFERKFPELFKLWKVAPMPLGTVNTTLAWLEFAEYVRQRGLREGMERVLPLVAELESARTAWHEDFGVPISKEHARFMEAIGALAAAIRSTEKAPEGK